MTQTADVVIIGGGVTGLSTALHLAQARVGRVVVLERHHVGAGQSGRAAGVVRALVPHRRLSGWLFESQHFFKTFTQRFGHPLEVNEVGYLLLVDVADETKLNDSIATATDVGADVRRLDGNEANALQAGLRQDEQTLYAFESGALHVDPMPATISMAAAARASGVKVVEGCEVGQILVEGNRVRGVQTTHERFETPNLLIASSAWGSSQLARLGVDVPVYPHRAEMGFFHVPPTRTHLLTRILSDARTQIYLRPEGQLQMFVGWREGDIVAGPESFLTENPDHYKQTAEYESLARMQQRLSQTLPFMKDGFVHRTYACVYDYTPDGQPILDRADDIEGLYFAIGHSGGGFGASPCVGRTMARYIIDGTAPEEIVWVNLRRFTEGKLVDWSNAG